jgi:hypothetical protein
MRTTDVQALELSFRTGVSSGIVDRCIFLVSDVSKMRPMAVVPGLSISGPNRTGGGYYPAGGNASTAVICQTGSHAMGAGWWRPAPGRRQSPQHGYQRPNGDMPVVRFSIGARRALSTDRRRACDANAGQDTICSIALDRG